MLPYRALLPLIFISLTVVDANPLSRSTSKTTLNFSTRVTDGSTLGVIERDRSRIRAIKNASQAGKGNKFASVTNEGLIYSAQVGVGSPKSEYTLIIDVGSSNTWIGANKAYTKTSTSHDTGNTVSVSYGSGQFSGEEWTDTVMLAPSLVIKNQSIGVASVSNGFSTFDGILGLGPVDLTSNTVSNKSTVPTVLNNLRSQGAIYEEVLGIYYVPFAESTNGNATGALTFGGYDNSVITGSVKYVPLTTTYPASTYWGIDQSISYGNTTILSSTAGIVDTGTTLIFITTDAFQKYQSATNSTPDSSTGLLKISTSNYSRLQSLSFDNGGMSLTLSPNAQIWPRSLNTAIGGSSNSIYLVIADIGADLGDGLEFIIGYTFLERYYSVLDTPNKRVGFASTAYTHSDTN